MPIQCIKLVATAPWTVLQAEIYEYAYLLLATLGYTGIILLCSALIHSNFAVLLLSPVKKPGPLIILAFSLNCSNKLQILRKIKRHVIYALKNGILSSIPP